MEQQGGKGVSIIEKALNKSRRTGSDEDVQNWPGAAREQQDQESSSPSRIERAMEAVHERDTSEQGVESAPVHEAAPEPETTRRYEKISRTRLAEMGLISPDGTQRSQLAEEFRLIKRPLLSNAFGGDAQRVPAGNLVMLTSALPGEGKSFCSINLALSIAMELDRTVLLVDADVARPTIPQYLGIDGTGPGLLDLLADDEVDFPEALIRTDIEQLTILPAGRTYPKATEMLASHSMEKLITEMSTRYPDRVILFDSPPLLATSEASALARHMGQIVMVVESEKTPRESIVRASEQLDGCDVVIPLLNKSRPLPGMKYAHGYYGAYERT